MHAGHTILIVEDEPAIADALSYALKQEHYHTHWVSLGADAITAFEKEQPSLVILDVGLPDISGFEVCKALRQKADVPILFLTARSEEIDRILGFELGADDYVAKPFSPREIVSRVKAIIRRSQSALPPEMAAQAQQNQNQVDSIETVAPSTQTTPDEKPQPLITTQIGPFTWQPQARSLIYKGQTLNLTRYEYGILTLLMQQPKRIYSRDQIMTAVWSEAQSSMDRVIDTHVKAIRAKLRAIDAQQQIIITHRGVGYSVDWSAEGANPA